MSHRVSILVCAALTLVLVLLKPTPLAAQTGALEPGFPVSDTGLPGSSEVSGPSNNVVVANIDADVQLELVSALDMRGHVGAWNWDGTMVKGWPVKGDSSVRARLAAGNLHPALPGMEVVAVYSASNSAPYELAAYSGAGTLLPGFPINLPAHITSAPVMADMDGDGLDEILVGTASSQLFAFKADGTALAGWPQTLPGTSAGTPSIADLDGDGESEIIVVSFVGTSSWDAYLNIYHHTGSVKSGLPIVFRRYGGLLTYSAYVAIGDMDGDSRLEMLVIGDKPPNTDTVVRVFSDTGTVEREIVLPRVHMQTASVPTLADLDGDGIPEILVQHRAGVSVYRGDGSIFSGWPVSFYMGMWHENMTPIVGDINGDNMPEVVIATQRGGDCTWGDWFIYDRNGKLQPGFSHGIPSGSGGVPAIADFDRDGRNEVVIVGMAGCSSSYERLSAFDFGGGPSGPIQWGQFGNGTQHTGVYYAPPTVVDLDLSISDKTDPIPAGGKLVYPITVTNLGSRQATNVQLAVTLPEGTTFVEATTNRGVCSQTDGLVSCGLGTLINGDSAMVNVAVQPLATGNLTLLASVTAAQSEANLSNNIVSETTTVIPGADLAVKITANGQRFTPGKPITYTVTVQNHGPYTATDVQLTSNLPTGLTVVSANPIQGSYNSSSHLWTIGELAVEATATIELNTVAEIGTTPKLLTYEATITHSEPKDPDTSNNIAKFDTPIDIADLSLTINLSNNLPLQDTDETISLMVKNNGGSTATGIVVSSLLPQGLTLVSTNSAYDAVSGLWTVGNLAPQQSVTLLLQTHINTGTTGQTLAVQASIVQSDQFDPVPTNNLGTASLIVGGVDLSLNGWSPAYFLAEGDSATVTFELDNLQANPATGVTINITVPTDFAVITSSPTSGTYEAGVWILPLIEGGTTATLSLDVQALPGAGGKTLSIAAALADLYEPDILDENNLVSISFTVQGADLKVQQSVSNPMPKEGDTITFQVTVTNNGPSVASGIWLNDLLPAGLIYQLHTVSIGTYDSETGDWSIGVLNPWGSPARLTLRALVDSGTNGSVIENIARITAHDLPDPDANNDTFSSRIGVGGVDIAISAMSVDNISPGEETIVNYSVAVGTVGSDPASNVRVETILPTGLTFVSAAPSTGTYDSVTGIWLIEAVLGSEDVTLDITAQVNSSTTGQVITHTARILSADQYDANPSNDSKSVTIIVGKADLSIVKTVDDQTPDPGQTITFTVTVSNPAPFATTGIQVTDLLPDLLTFVSASASTGSYDSITGYWMISRLDGASSATLDLTATVKPEAFGQLITNSAAITASTNPDSQESNNQSSVTIRVNQIDLAVSISDSADPLYAETAFSYTISITNSGTMTATGVSLVLSPSAELQATSTSHNCTGELMLTCSIGTVSAGETITVTLNVVGRVGITGLASLSAQVSADQPEHNLINNMDAESTGLTHLVVNSSDDINDGGCSDAHCSLREAILAANAMSGADTIRFNIGDGGVQTIRLTAALPIITGTVTIDGSTQPGYNDLPMIELSGENITASDQHGLYLTAGNNTLRALAINRFTGDGIRLSGPGSNTIVGCFIGTDASGTQEKRNRGNGLNIAAPNNQIGGETETSRNIIVGNNSRGLYILSSGNKVQGNYIGVDISGRAGISNIYGSLELAGSDNIVGGMDAASRNIIASSSGSYEVLVGGSNNIIQGNFIGTDATGTQDFGYAIDGVYVTGGYNLIGGVEPGAGNLISSYRESLRVEGGRTTIQGNLIGTDIAATKQLGIAGSGIVVAASNNIIGGTVPGARNVIANSVNNGVALEGGNNTVQGNLIGTDITGTVVMPHDYGVYIRGSGNLIGGTTPEARNVISGNRVSGIWIYLTSAQNNRIQGNYIGTDITGEKPLGNGEYGIRVSFTSWTGTNWIGGTESGAGNRIAYNAKAGIAMSTYSDPLTLTILGNEIFRNGGLGIDISTEGVLPNDPGDADSGVNKGQNYPVLSSAILENKTLSISGVLDSTLNTNYRVEFFSSRDCDASGYGEGENLIGTATIAVSATSPVSFDLTFNDVNLVGQYITATATDPNNNTSEFSACVALVGADLSLDMSASGSAFNNGDSVTYSIKVTNNGPDIASGVIVDALLPTGLIYQSHTGGTYSAETGVWNIGGLANNAMTALTVTALIDTGTTGQTLTFKSTVSANESDINLLNNEKTTTIIVAVADLQIINEVSDAGPNVGDVITYITVVNNDGPSDASGIMIFSPLPEGVTFADQLLTQGTYDETTGNWTIGSLTKGAQASLTVRAMVDAGTAGRTISNIASVITEDQADPIQENNMDTTSILVSVADTGMAGIVDNSNPLPGEAINVTITLTNDGPSDATDVVVESPLPEGITFTTATVSNGHYDAATGEWTVSRLADKNEAILTISGMINAGTGSQTLTQQSSIVDTDQLDLNDTNDNSSITIRVKAESDLALSSIAESEIVNRLQMVTYVITLMNNGSSEAQDVVVHTILPDKLEFVAASTAIGLYERISGLWRVGDIQVGESVTLTVTGRVRAGVTQPTILLASSIASAQPNDPNPGNNSTNTSVNVQVVPDVPVLITPENESMLPTQQPTLRWNAATGASKYQLVFGRTNSPTELVDNIIGTEYTLSTLLQGGTYYWQVQAVSQTNNASGWSLIRQFTVTSPSSALPERNVYTAANLVLTWGQVSWATGYEIQVGKTFDVSMTLVFQKEVGASTASVQVSDLEKGRYYWRVRAKHSTGWGAWSKVESFTLTTP